MTDSPMASLEQIRLECRLAAIENILAGLYGKVNLLLGVSPEQFAKECEEVLQTLQQIAVPGVDAAQSDLFAGELLQAHEALIKKIDSSGWK